MRPGFAWTSPYSLTPGQPTPGITYLPASPLRYLPRDTSGSLRRAAPWCPASGGTRTRWYGNINPLCIDYASRPRLSSRLTLGGLAFPRNPWVFGGGVSHPSFATHAGIRTRTRSTSVSTAASLPVRHSPTTTSCEAIRSFGSRLEPRYIVRAGPLDQ